MRPRPNPDLDSAAWWDALQRRELLLQRCDDCSRYRWPSRPLCNECSSVAWHWEVAGGGGSVMSWTVTHHSFGPSVDVPFAVALVRVDEQDDIAIPGYIDLPSRGPELAIGDPVVVDFVSVECTSGDDVLLLRWLPAGP